MKWPIVPLADICELKYGRSLPASRRAKGSFEVYGSNGVVGRHSEALSDGPTIVVGRKGSFGEVNFSSTSCWPIDTTYYADQTASQADLRWLFHLLRTLGLNKMNRAAAVPGLNREDAYRKRVALPPLEEQKRIAALLDKAEEVIGKRRAALALLDQIPQSLFLEMFGDPATNPFNFVRAKLHEFCDLQNGYAFSSSDYVDSSSTLNCRMSNIRPDGTFDPHYNPKYLPDAFAKKYHNYLLKDGDVIIAMTDMASEARILGVPTVVQTDGKEMLLNQRVGKLKLDPGVVSFAYLKQALSDTGIKQYYMKFASGGVQINLGKSDLLSATILLPPPDLQQSFANRVEVIQRAKTGHQIALSVSEALFTTLQESAFSTKQ